MIVALLLITPATSSCFRKSSLAPQAKPIPPTPTVVQNSLPARNGLINDYASVFDPAEEKRLELMVTELLHDLEVEFAIVTIDSTNGQSLFDYSLALARDWKPGGEKGRGLLLVLAIKDRQWRLQVSKALERELPNEVCQELAQPSLEFYKQGKYADGVDLYVRAIGDRLRAGK